MSEEKEVRKYPKLEDAQENEPLVEKTQAPWKWLIICGIILLLMVACIVVIFTVK